MPEPTGGSTRAKQGPTATHCPDAYWAGHAYSTHVGTPVSVQRCHLCGYIDWADLADQVATLTADLTRERDEARVVARCANKALIDATANAARLADLLRETLAERDEARVERDQLAAALDRAASVRVDAHGVIWHAAPEGRWRHRIYGTRTLDRVESIFGRTRPALLVALDDDVQPTPAPDPMAALGPEITARRQIAAELDRVAASDRLTAAWLERHGLGGQLAPSPPAILRALALDIAAGEVHGRREQFDASVPPGGYVCAEPDPEMPDGICGMPVEDVPCTVHHPGSES